MFTSSLFTQIFSSISSRPTSIRFGIRKVLELSAEKKSLNLLILEKQKELNDKDELLENSKKDFKEDNQKQSEYFQRKLDNSNKIRIDLENKLEEMAK